MKHLKQIFLFCLTLIVISCNSNDEDLELNRSINPPNWIIGTWLDETDPDWAQIGGFQFTNDNFLDIFSDRTTITLNLKEDLKEGLISGIISIDEVLTEEEYEIKILSNRTLVNHFKFSKGTDNQTIIYSLTATRDVILSKQ